MPTPPLRKRLAMVLNSLPSYAEIDLVSSPTRAASTRSG
jgi:hypothetical protein